MPRFLVHGWWNIRGEKMSKSLGNIVDPDELADTFGADALRYYLLRDIATGHDADFDLERLVMRYNTELANDLGNLCNRALNMSQRFTDGVLRHGGRHDGGRRALQASPRRLARRLSHRDGRVRGFQRLEALNRHVAHCNGYAERMKPWELTKDPENKAASRIVRRNPRDTVSTDVGIHREMSCSDGAALGCERRPPPYPHPTG